MKQRFRFLRFDIEDGEYSGIINAYKLSPKGTRIQLEIELEGSAFLLRPASISTDLTEKNVLFRYFEEAGYSMEDVNEISFDDLIGEEITFSIEHNLGKTVTFCNIAEIHRKENES